MMADRDPQMDNKRNEGKMVSLPEDNSPPAARQPFQTKPKEPQTELNREDKRDSNYQHNTSKVRSHTHARTPSDAR